MTKKTEVKEQVEEKKTISLDRIKGSEYCSAKCTAKKLTYSEMEKVFNGTSKDKSADIKTDIEEVKVLLEKYPQQLQLGKLMSEMAEARFKGIDMDNLVELVVNGIKLNLKEDAETTKGN